MSIYLDNSATTQVRQEVIDEMLPYMAQHFGNPSSAHAKGKKAADALKLARERVAALLNASPEEIYFSPCGTYSNNAAILGRARFAEANGMGRHLITSQIEHPSVMGPAQYLEANGWKVTYLPVSAEGIVRMDELEKAITPETSIISVMWGNNEIGSLQPIGEIAELALNRGVFFHTDAVQMPGKLPLDVSTVRVAALSLSGHKFYAPKGIGILFLRKGENLMPTAFGGGQEMGLMPGTEALPAIVAIGKAAELARQELPETEKHLRAMADVLKSKLQVIDGVKITGPQSLDLRIPGHLSITVSGAEGEGLVMRCDLKNICVSSGSACHKGIIEPSHILRALKLPDREARGSLRISAGRFNTIEECERAGDAIQEIMRTTAALSARGLT
ncbi:MAG TPA: cysteine desulfurase family protein [Candidatus Obscuribacterales bacterium]